MCCICSLFPQFTKQRLNGLRSEIDDLRKEFNQKLEESNQKIKDLECTGFAYISHPKLVTHPSYLSGTGSQQKLNAGPGNEVTACTGSAFLPISQIHTFTDLCSHQLWMIITSLKCASFQRIDIKPSGLKGAPIVSHFCLRLWIGSEHGHISYLCGLPTMRKSLWLVLR